MLYLVLATLLLDAVHPGSSVTVPQHLPSLHFQTTTKTTTTTTPAPTSQVVQGNWQFDKDVNFEGAQEKLASLNSFLTNQANHLGSNFNFSTQFVGPDFDATLIQDNFNTSMTAAWDYVTLIYNTFISYVNMALQPVTQIGTWMSGMAYPVAVYTFLFGAVYYFSQLMLTVFGLTADSKASFAAYLNEMVMAFGNFFMDKFGGGMALSDEQEDRARRAVGFASAEDLLQLAKFVHEAVEKFSR